MKILLLLLTVLFCLSGCTPAEAPSTQTSVPTTAEASVPAVIQPLPGTIDVTRLDNCTVAVSLEAGDVYVDDTGAMQIKVTVYDYDLYDMVDMAKLKEGDLLTIRGQEITVTVLERTLQGSIRINGGLDVGGYELQTDENGVYYEIGYSDVKFWYPLGEAIIPISADFLYTDRSDLDAEPKVYSPSDFLMDGAGIDYHFTPHNTTITIENGKIIAMERFYTP